ncbi:MAG: hypothetical protein ACTMIX_03380 [Kluyvera intermedia]
MNKYLLLAVFAFSLSAQAADNFVQDVKDIFHLSSRVDYSDWYNKGDTAFAEFDGLNYGVYQHLKAAVRKDEVSIKMDYVSGNKRPNTDDFARTTSELCFNVISQTVLASSKKATPASWNDDGSDQDNSSPISFFLVNKFNDVSQVTQSVKANGWDIEITRHVLSTSCSARKNSSRS